MAAEFLNKLSISDETRAKLSTFGVSSPFALLSIRKASKAAFDSYIGGDQADTVASQIETLLTDEERESLKKPNKAAGELGARLGPPPKSIRAS